MSRYIDADALKKRMLAVFEDDGIGVVLNGYWNSKLVREIIDEQPTADVPPVVHGKWEECEIVQESGDEPIIDEWQSARCSVCGKYHTTPYMYFFDHFNYCPNCGAKMERREDAEIH